MEEILNLENKVEEILNLENIISTKEVDLWLILGIFSSTRTCPHRRYRQPKPQPNPATISTRVGMREVDGRAVQKIVLQPSTLSI